MSKYYAIYLKLKEAIEQGEFQKGELLPSENELMKTYEASRDTIRKALTLLAQNGLIQKNKGKGSIVLQTDRISFPVSGVISFKELAKERPESIKTHVKKVCSIKADQTLSKEMSIPPDTELYKIERVRQYDDEKIIYDIDYLIKDIVPFMDERIAGDSLYEYIENTLHLPISYAQKEITVQSCTATDQEYLDMLNYNLVVVVKSLVYLEDTRLFQFTESRHRPDKFRFVDFARRLG